MFGVEVIAYIVSPDGCTLPPKTELDFFSIHAKDPVDKLQESIRYSGRVNSGLFKEWSHEVEGLEPHPYNETESNHWFYNFFFEQTLRVDRTNSEIKFHRHVPKRDLVVGYSSTCSIISTKDRGVKSLFVFLFEEQDPEGRFAKFTFIRFPGHYIEDMEDQREFLGHFLKHWWRPESDSGSPYIFHNQKHGQ